MGFLWQRARLAWQTHCGNSSGQDRQETRSLVRHSRNSARVKEIHINRGCKAEAEVVHFLLLLLSKIFFFFLSLPEKKSEGKKKD